ncbi:MAG: calcium/sodium antiporter [Proteobacteria bacterium]|jgi:cation:H+ antiporter|uniref:Calcium:proton antiporter n=1 Tax=SAR92 bacterium BACL26 MAG-121220-bin70 TaxID=1655626 RepID=A0A0R2UAR5_9GAMM|nr:MAG: calcium:proton antiporter [SAR92 bacterium BACL26 MAG-121220-bin70]MDA0795295.1 calcium/sodium antiporter [Pseudomonadota bacterium]MDA1351437.1 calcium/sodium antiporter [Pseudomonadota bacterium]
MSTLYLPIIALLAGVLGLVWGADKFVTGSVGVARNFGISSMIIGLTVVSIGTSAPEIIVSINAALNNAGGLAVGNALGSNLANIGLVLGITALVAPLPVQTHLLKEEGPVLLLITLLAGLCLYDGQLNRGESIALGLLVIPLIAILVKYKKNHPNPEAAEDTIAATGFSMKTSGLWLLLGLIILLLSAEITVWGATSIARFFGISDLIVGLTIVAIGTSLPELAASVVSATKGHHDIAVGNIFGSNLFNLLLVMTTAGAIAPMALPNEVFSRDYLSLLVMTVLMIGLVGLTIRKHRHIGSVAYLSRFVGFVLLTSYGLYYVLLWSSLTIS